MYRKLTEAEIAQLKQQGCEAKDWGTIEVAQDFDATYVRGARFSGKIRLGAFRREIQLPGGLSVHTGIGLLNKV